MRYETGCDGRVGGAKRATTIADGEVAWSGAPMRASSYLCASKHNSDFPKYSLTATPNQWLSPRRLIPQEGRIAIVTDAGWDAVDAAASGA
jgi:hypothetical protein